MNNHLGRFWTSGTNKLSLLTALYFSCFLTVLTKFSVSIQMPQVVTILEETFHLHICGMWADLPWQKLHSYSFRNWAAISNQAQKISANCPPCWCLVPWHPLLRNSAGLSPFSVFSLPSYLSVRLKDSGSPWWGMCHTLQYLCCIDYCHWGGNNDSDLWPAQCLLALSSGININLERRIHPPLPSALIWLSFVNSWLMIHEDISSCWAV